MSGLPPASNPQLSQVLVIVDKFSKYTILEPCPATMTALDTAKVFIRRVIANFGLPKVVISDRGPQFSAAVWKAILEGLGSKVALATSHHPQTDGQTERAIQTLLRIVRSFAVDQAADWQEMLPLFQFAINNAASSASRLSPFQVLFGMSPLAPTSVITAVIQMMRQDRPTWDYQEPWLNGQGDGGRRDVVCDNLYRNVWRPPRRLPNAVTTKGGAHLIFNLETLCCCQ